MIFEMRNMLDTASLADALARNNIGEREGFYYYLGNSILVTLLAYYGVLQEIKIDLLFFLEVVIVLVITVVGLLISYKENGGSDGESFVIRATCLAFSVGVKINILSFMLSWALFLVYPGLIDALSFRHPGRIYNFISFIWAPVFTAVFYWRLVVWFQYISEASKQNE